MGDERTARTERAYVTMTVRVDDHTVVRAASAFGYAYVSLGDLLLTAPSWPEMRRFTADLAMAVGERAAEVEADAEKAADEPEFVATGDAGF